MRLVFLPFELIWRLVAFFVGLAGRSVSILLGLVLLVVGVILCVTVIGIVVGIPLILLGLLLIARGFF
jgi:hypothetical protein